MDIIGGLDVHRKQITFDYLEIETGEVKSGQITPATREQLRHWLRRFEEQAGGIRTGSHHGLAIRGRGARARRDRGTSGRARGHQSLEGKQERPRPIGWTPGTSGSSCSIGRLPESWIAPSHIQDLRTLGGCARRWSRTAPPGNSASTPSSFTTATPRSATAPKDRRANSKRLGAATTARKRVELSLRMIDHINEEFARGREPS